LAPLLIGLIRTHAGWGSVLGVAAASFVLASLLILRLRTHANPEPSQASVLADMAQGFRAVGGDRLLRQLMLAAVIGYAMTGPLQILLPKLARQELGLSESARGAYLGLLAVSLICGGVLALLLSRRLHHGHTIFGGIFLGGGLFALLATIRQPALSALVLAGVGILGGMVISLVVAGIQGKAPAPMRGRVMAMYSITSQVLPALSGVLAGGMVSMMGVSWSITASGAALALIALLGALSMTTLWRHTGR
jgi:MFS family permease